jgi:hypothetical protein
VNARLLYRRRPFLPGAEAITVPRLMFAMIKGAAQAQQAAAHKINQ